MRITHFVCVCECVCVRVRVRICAYNMECEEPFDYRCVCVCVAGLVVCVLCAIYYIYGVEENIVRAFPAK